MGKFYELYEMDAHVGAKDLDLQYMKARTSPWKILIDSSAISAIQLTFYPITQNSWLFCIQSCYHRVNSLTVDSQRRIYQ